MEVNARRSVYLYLIRCEELLDPALKGTLNVLGSCAKTPSVKRVIITSSEAAIAFNCNPRTSDAVIDESWWADADMCREHQGTGSETYGNTAYGWVHVKDVVDAHVLAYEKPEANGRYYIVERCARPFDLVEILRELYPHLKFPEKTADRKPLVENYKVNTEKAKKLGVSFTPLKQALKDTVESLKEKGFFKEA
ncbi:Cinnamoyl-CoA reductase [Castilleja foliolosa]|uniref:Cinnamoyl-CoA reductase n=1 Tax=Castilleja foliolosa TaxID=1961234 RepID=A0ABD3DMF3_9LAMI